MKVEAYALCVGILIEMVDALCVKRGRASLDAVNLVAFLKK
jgi:hypothetical protein